MKTFFVILGMAFIQLSCSLYVYNKGLIDGKYNYRNSKSFQMTLDSAYRYGVWDGEEIGFSHGYIKGGEDCKAAFLKLSHKEKKRFCR